MEYDINKLVRDIDFTSNSLVDVGNGIMLTNREIEILDNYKINYKNSRSLSEIIFQIEEIIIGMDIVDEELDYVSSSIAERDYYENTNK